MGAGTGQELGNVDRPETWVAAGGAFILCLPEADYVTGQCLEITGGLVY